MTTAAPEILDDNLVERSAVRRVERLSRAVPDNRSRADQDEARPSILRLYGLGKEIWQGIDVRRYVDDLRDEWTR